MPGCVCGRGEAVTLATEMVPKSRRLVAGIMYHESCRKYGVREEPLSPPLRGSPG